MVDKDIVKCYENLANAIIVSAINDYVTWKVQEHFYPGDKELELISQEAGGNKRKMTIIKCRHSQVVDRGMQAKHFLESPVRVRMFTNFTSEELMSFARKKVQYTIEDLGEKGIQHRFRVGVRGQRDEER